MSDDASVNTPLTPAEPVGTGVPPSTPPAPTQTPSEPMATPTLETSPLAGLAQEVKTSAVEPPLIVPNVPDEKQIPVDVGSQNVKSDEAISGPKKKKSRIGPTLIVVLLLLTIPVGVYYVAQRNKQVTEQRSQAGYSPDVGRGKTAIGVVGQGGGQGETIKVPSSAAPASTTTTVTTAPSLPTCADSDLMSYWPMDETSGTAVADSKGNYPATAINNPGIVDGKYGKARSFTVAAKNKVQTNASASFAAGKAFATSAWVKPTGDNSGYAHGIVGHGTQGTVGSGWFLAAAHNAGNNQPGCFMAPASASDGNSVGVLGSQMATGQWYKITSVYTGSAIHCYVNDTWVGGATAAIPAINAPIVIGSVWSNYDNYYVNADIDDVKIWNTACNPAGTTSPTPTPTPPDVIAQWDMDDTDNTIRDVTGNGHNGTATGTNSVDGVCSSTKAREFFVNSGASYIDVPYSAVQNVISNFSFETWVKFLDTSGAGFTLFNNRDVSTTTNQGYGLSIFRDSDNKIYFQAGNGTWLAAGNCSTYNTITDTNWHHFVAVQRGDRIQLYLDGSRVGDCAGSAVAYNTSNNLRMGSSSTQMRTVLDTTVLWGRQLTESEISSRYTSKVACLTPTTTPTVTSTPTPTPKTVTTTTTTVVTPTTQPTPKVPVSGTPSVLGVSTAVGGVLLLLLGLLL